MDTTLAQKAGGNMLLGLDPDRAGGRQLSRHARAPPDPPARDRHAARPAAVLSVFPIDTFIPEPCAVMQVVGEPDALPPVQAEMNAVLANHGAKPAVSLERHTFYAAAETAHAIVQTGERRFYGDILLAELRLPTRQLRIKAKAATKSSSLKGLQTNGAALNSGGISDGWR
jgi:hypothetical protein